MPPEERSNSSALRSVLRTLAEGHTLGADETERALLAIMANDATPAQVGAFLLGMRVRGETAQELAGAVRAFRQAMLTVGYDRPTDLVDTCGTGGGSVTTFNVSTIAAFVAAGAGVRIAKHGNRSYTSSCGSADVLEALGIPLDLSPEALTQVLRDTGIVFMFAPSMHPAMRVLAPVRRELGVPTLMNLVGPLANPASAGRQVIGVSDPGRLIMVAHALYELGCTHALVIYGEPGLDEISPLGVTHVVEVRADRAREERWTIDPKRHGVTGVKLDDLSSGDPTRNAAIAAEILSGGGNAGARAAVMLNAAAAIYVSGQVGSFDEAVPIARHSLELGAAMAAFTRMKNAYARHAAPSTAAQ